MRGNMNILGKTNVTYVLKDSPLTVNDRLGDMVTFVNFNDTTSVEESSVQQISLGGMDVAMTMHIDQAVQARVDPCRTAPTICCWKEAETCHSSTLLRGICC